MAKFPQSTPRLIARLRRHARVLRAVGAELAEGSGPLPLQAISAMANVNDQAAGRLEDFLTAHGSDVQPVAAEEEEA